MTVDPSPMNANTDESLDLLIRSDENIQLNNERSKKHSARVRRLRLLFPIAALAVIVVLMTWKSDNAPLTAVPREEISPQTVSQNELIKPKFQSEDENGQPYTITADKATQNAENMDLLLLQQPVADIALKSGDTISLKAANGLYSQGKKDLDLDGQVEIHHDSGYEIKTQKMKIDVQGQIITSDTPVIGSGPEADISASGLNVNGNSKVLIFNGPAKLTLHKAPATDPTSSPTSKDE